MFTKHSAQDPAELLHRANNYQACPALFSVFYSGNELCGLNSTFIIKTEQAGTIPALALQMGNEA